jgi:hypothetical protein
VRNAPMLSAGGPQALDGREGKVLVEVVAFLA